MTEFVHLSRQPDNQWSLQYLTIVGKIDVTVFPGIRGLLERRAAKAREREDAAAYSRRVERLSLPGYVIAAVHISWVSKARVVQIYGLGDEKYLRVTACKTYFGMPSLKESYIIARDHLRMFADKDFCAKVVGHDSRHAERVEVLQHMARVYFYGHPSPHAQSRWHRWSKQRAAMC